MVSPEKRQELTTDNTDLHGNFDRKAAKKGRPWALGCRL
jgi:hypothetical protein